MDLAILEAIKYIKQISKKKVSLKNILQRINKTNATNIDIDTLRIDVDNMLRNGIIDQDYKILKNHIDGDETLKTIPFLTENTNKINENKNTASPLPLTQVTPNKSLGNSRNIKIFSDSIPKGIRIKQMNQQIKNGNARIHSFPGATSHQLLHYLDVNLDKYTDAVVIHIGINGILNSASNVNGLLSNIKHMIKKCRNFGVKYIFISGLVYTKRIITEFLEDVHLKLANVCKEMQVCFIDNRNITGFYLFRDGLHLLESRKMLLANNFVSNFSNFLSVKHRTNLFP